jgi:hypothetical protein
MEIVTPLFNVCCKHFRWSPRTPTVIADKNLSPRLEPFEEAFEQGWFILQNTRMVYTTASDQTIVV